MRRWKLACLAVGALIASCSAQRTNDDAGTGGGSAGGGNIGGGTQTTGGGGGGGASTGGGGTGDAGVCDIASATAFARTVGHAAVSLGVDFQFRSTTDCLPDGVAATAQVTGPDGVQLTSTIENTQFQPHHQYSGTVRFTPAIAGHHQVTVTIDGMGPAAVGDVLVARDLFPDSGTPYGQPAGCDYVDVLQSGRAVCQAGSTLAIIDPGGNAFTFPEAVSTFAVGSTVVWVEVPDPVMNHPSVVRYLDLGTGAPLRGPVTTLPFAVQPGYPIAADDVVVFSDVASGLIRFDYENDGGTLIETEVPVSTFNGNLGIPAYSPSLHEMLVAGCRLPFPPDGGQTCSAKPQWTIGPFAADSAGIWGTLGNVGYGLAVQSFDLTPTVYVMAGNIFEPGGLHFPASPLVIDSDTSERFMARVVDGGIELFTYHWPGITVRGGSTSYVWGYDDGGTLWVMPP